MTRSTIPVRRAAIVASVLVAGLLLSACTAPTSPAATPGAGANPRPTPTAGPSATPVASAVSAITPAVSGVAGGTPITISGTGLSSATTVLIGGRPATNVVVVDASTITATTPEATNFQPASAVVLLQDAAGQQVADGAIAYEVQSGTDAQMQYAFAHWNNYNTAEWGNLNTVGGDCANFVSQTLIARGWQQNATWYNKGAGADWSPTWGYSPAMEDWFQNTPSLGLTRLSLDQKDQVKIGDVGMFDWNVNGTPDHVMIVSRVTVENGVTKLAFVSHNSDGDFRELETVLNVDHPGATAWFWSVPA